MNRPPLLQLGGEDAFSAYQAAFDLLFLAGPIRDVLGRLITFRLDACRHVCYIPASEGASRNVWIQERAERLVWILLALQGPSTEIRPDHKDPRRQAYLLTIPADPPSGHSQERYGVYVEPIGSGIVEFKTGFSMREAYGRDARNEGPRLYPLPKPKKSRGKKH